MNPVPFPNRVLKVGSIGSELVTKLQRALEARGYGPFNAGVFDTKMA